MSEVVSRKATPEEIADLDRRARLKYDGLPVKRWEPTLTKQQYFDKRAAGDSRQSLILKYYNNESEKLAKQLREWGFRNWKEEIEEVESLAKGVKTALTITKDEYLQRLLAGETRSRIMRTLGGSQTKFYKLLEEWGIRELDAEERALDLLAPDKPASEVDRRTAELLEQKAIARGLNEINAQFQSAAPSEAAAPAEAKEEKSAEEKPAGQEILERVEQRAEEKDQVLLKLQKERDELKVEVESLMRYQKAAAKLQEAEQRIRELEAEVNMLLGTIEAAALEASDSGYVTIRMPVLPVATANVERARIYDAVEALGAGVEAAEIDRERVMKELFMLLQRAVSFVTADLAELLPGQDVSEHVQRFFQTHNVRHIASVATTREAV